MPPARESFDPTAPWSRSAHYEPTEDAASAGVYRVVGTGDPVVPLRVASADGRRVNSGEVHAVGTEPLASAFEPAGDPDAGFTPIRGLANAASGLYWQFRRFL